MDAFDQNGRTNGIDTVSDSPLMAGDVPLFAWLDDEGKCTTPLSPCGASSEEAAPIAAKMSFSSEKITRRKFYGEDHYVITCKDHYKIKARQEITMELIPYDFVPQRSVFFIKVEWAKGTPKTLGVSMCGEHMKELYGEKDTAEKRGVISPLGSTKTTIVEMSTIEMTDFETGDKNFLLRVKLLRNVLAGEKIMLGVIFPGCLTLCGHGAKKTQRMWNLVVTGALSANKHIKVQAEPRRNPQIRRKRPRSEVEKEEQLSCSSETESDTEGLPEIIRKFKIHSRFIQEKKRILEEEERILEEKKRILKKEEMKLAYYTDKILMGLTGQKLPKLEDLFKTG